MESPDIYQKNLSKGIITDDMLGAALFSLNKRAKNYRDQKRKAKKSLYAQAKLFGFDNPDGLDESEKMEKDMYRKKETLLQVVEPICIHQEIAGYKKEYIYDVDGTAYDYGNLFIDAIFHNRVLDRGVCRKDRRDTRFFVRKGEAYYRYYYFRQVKDHTYHSPISKEEALRVDLPIHVIREIKTEGEPESELISMEFVDALIDLVESGRFQYTAGDTAAEIRESLLPSIMFTIPHRYEWSEVKDILKEKYPEKTSVLDSTRLTARLWSRIMKKESASSEGTITAAWCLKCILAEERRISRRK